MTVSVIVPTRNRAVLWRSGWLLDSLAEQTRVPDELVIALDHTEDDTLYAIHEQVCCRKPPFPVRILEVISPRACELQASAIADNCLFAAASGDVLIHLDDDIALGLEFCRRTLAVLACSPRAVIWAGLRFVHPDRSPLTDHPPIDRRPATATRHHWPTITCGATPLPAHWQAHHGGAWAAPRAEILAIGGHDLSLAQYRNADARLGNRLVRAGLQSLITITADFSAYHVGHTHHSRQRHGDRSRGPTSGPRIANGGPDYWTSDACRQSYREF